MIKDICYEERPHYIVILYNDIKKLSIYLQNIKRN